MSEELSIHATNDRPQTIVELIERIERERGALEQLVAGMSDDDLIATSDGWTAKVHLAHVAAWERRLIGELQGDLNAARFGLDETDYEDANTDGLNAMLLARFQVDSPAAARAEFLAAGEALRAAIADLNDADLSLPRPDDDEGETVLDMISWDTYKHYPEHVAAIASRS
ncbi:hypothetical protein BH09CHL1_BH09CHL1_02880 [soil metagenome]